MFHSFLFCDIPNRFNSANNIPSVIIERRCLPKKYRLSPEWAGKRSLGNEGITFPGNIGISVLDKFFIRNGYQIYKYRSTLPVKGERVFIISFAKYLTGRNPGHLFNSPVP